jgi:hypothetical protein
VNPDRKAQQENPFHIPFAQFSLSALSPDVEIDDGSAAPVASAVLGIQINF